MMLVTLPQSIWCLPNIKVGKKNSCSNFKMMIPQDPSYWSCLIWKPMVFSTASIFPSLKKDDHPPIGWDSWRRRWSFLGLELWSLVDPRPRYHKKELWDGDDQVMIGMTIDDFCPIKKGWSSSSICGMGMTRWWFNQSVSEIYECRETLDCIFAPRWCRLTGLNSAGDPSQKEIWTLQEFGSLVGSDADFTKRNKVNGWKIKELILIWKKLIACDHSNQSLGARDVAQRHYFAVYVLAIYVLNQVQHRKNPCWVAVIPPGWLKTMNHSSVSGASKNSFSGPQMASPLRCTMLEETSVWWP